MDKEIEQKLAELMLEYAANLPNKVNQILIAWKSLYQQTWQGEAWQEFYRLVHKLCGSSGIYGFKRLNQALYDIEVILKPLQNQAPTQVELDEIDKLIKNLSNIALVREAPSN